MIAKRVSVVIPTRNRIEKLRRALSSIEEQTFRDFDVCIVDDGSTDGTTRFLRQDHLVDKYPDIPFLNVLFNIQSVGAAAARNQAVVQSRGDLIAFLDDDDTWHPDYLKRQVENLDHHLDASLSYAGYVEVDHKGRLSRPDSSPLFRYDSPLIHLLTESFIHTFSIAVCRREAFDRIGLLDEGLNIVHDLDWYVRLLLIGGKIVSVEGCSLVVREMPGGLITMHRRWFEEEQGILGRACEQRRECARREGHIRAHRALLFARVGMKRKDYSFAAKRLLEAMRRAPLRSVQIALIRLFRNLFDSVRRPESTGHTRGPGSK